MKPGRQKVAKLRIKGDGNFIKRSFTNTKQIVIQQEEKEKPKQTEEISPATLG